MDIAKAKVMLMAKIEELILYMIELKKEDDAITQELKKIKK